MLRIRITARIRLIVDSSAGATNGWIARSARRSNPCILRANMDDEPDEATANIWEQFREILVAFWAEQVGPDDLGAMLESQKCAESYLAHADPVRRSVALKVLKWRWQCESDLAPICVNLALHDTDSGVRRGAIQHLSGTFADTKNRKIVRFLAGMLGDASQSVEIREEACEGLFCVWGGSLLSPLLKVPPIVGVASADQEWLVEQIRSFGASCPAEQHECPTCRSQMVNVLAGWRTLLCSKQQRLIASGRAVLGPDDGKPIPDSVCLTCFPEWTEFQRLAVEEYEVQLEKEAAIADRDFERAVLMRDRQHELRPRVKALSTALPERGDSV